jgi:hypothetical protein
MAQVRQEILNCGGEILQTILVQNAPKNALLILILREVTFYAGKTHNRQFRDVFQ